MVPTSIHFSLRCAQVTWRGFLCKWEFLICCMKYYMPLEPVMIPKVIEMRFFFHSVISIFFFTDNLKNSPEGRYLMSRYSNSGTKENHSRLSKWSKESIQEILQDFRMSYCLHDMKSAFCGDGIIQPGEDCDCGLTEDCLAKKSCCVQPGGGPKNQRECSYNSIRQIMKQCTA